MMPGEETEEQILQRIEAALGKISGALQGQRQNGGEIDREALGKSLDLMVSRLRSGLEPPKPTPELE